MAPVRPTLEVRQDRPAVIKVTVGPRAEPAIAGVRAAIPTVAALKEPVRTAQEHKAPERPELVHRAPARQEPDLRAANRKHTARSSQPRRSLLPPNIAAITAKQKVSALSQGATRAFGPEHPAVAAGLRATGQPLTKMAWAIDDLAG